MTNTKTEYASIPVPLEFVKEKIDPLVKQKRFGFASRTSVVVEAVKALAEKLAREVRDASDPDPIKTPEVPA